MTHNQSPLMKLITQKLLNRRVWLLLTIMIGIAIYSATVVFAQTDTATDVAADTENNACRLYTPNVDNVVVRACASTQCAIRDAFNVGETACVVSDNIDGWYEVNIDPDDPSSLPGYVSANLMSVGAADRDDVSFDFCDAYEVIGDNATIRTCSSIDCNALGQLTQGETVCVVRYGADYNNWVQIAGTDSWVDFTNFEYVFIEESDCDVYQVRVPTTTARSCPFITCGVTETLAQGTQICIGNETDEDTDWLGISYGDEDTIGWVFANLMSPTTLDSNEIFTESDAIRATVNAGSAVAQASTSTPDTSSDTSSTTTEAVEATPSSTIAPVIDAQAALDDALCTDFTVNTSAGTVRAAPSVDASQVINLPFGTTVCVTGVVPFLENDWFIVRVPNTEDEIVQAFMAQSVLNSTDEVLPTPTPSPVGNSTNQITTDSAGVAVAQPTVCPAGASAEDCAAVQVETREVIGAIQSSDLPLLNTSTNDNIILQSPQANATFRFLYPEDWASNGNDVLILNFDYFELNRGADTSQIDPISLLDITVNGELVQSLALDLDNVGPNTLTIPLPAVQMQDTEQRTHVIGFTLTALDHCREDLTARVEFDTASSFVSLRYNELEPTLNLADYPRPFFEAHPNGTEIVYVVIPDTPSPEELTAAGRIVAGLGSITEQLVVRTTTVSQLSDIEYVTNNLILIGLAGNHALIDDLYTQNVLPTSIDEDGNIIRNDAPVLEEDGVVQIIQHPVDPRFAILTVTGQTPVAIAKAGQLLAGDPPLIGLGGNVAIVSGISPSARPSVDSIISSRFTLADIGFTEDFVLSGGGLQSAFIEFFVPFGTIDGDDAYFNLMYNNSAIMEETASTLTVEVNGIPVGTTTLRPQEDLSGTDLVFNTRSLRVNIPNTAIFPGTVNFVRIVVNTVDEEDCRTLDDLSTWLTISSSSEMFLPFDVAPTLLPFVGLFPSPFNLNPVLSDVLVSIPEEPSTEELIQALTFMQRLGSSTRNVSAMNPIIVYGTPPDDLELSNFHLVVIGRPTNNSIYDLIGDSLPQPFTEGTDELEQVLNNVVYRLDDSYNVGLIQTFTSPFNSEKAVLVMSGTDDFTQALSVDVVGSTEVGSVELLGDVVFVSQESVFAVDTRLQSRAFDTLGVVPALATESELIRQETTVPLTQTVVANATQLASAGASVTPVPPTATISGAPDSDGETVLAPTAIVAIELEVTPLPTIQAFSADELTAEEATLPVWVRYFLIIAAVISVGMVVGRFVIAARENSESKKL